MSALMYFFTQVIQTDTVAASSSIHGSLFVEQTALLFVFELRRRPASDRARTRIAKAGAISVAKEPLVPTPLLSSPLALHRRASPPRPR